MFLVQQSPQPPPYAARLAKIGLKSGYMNGLTSGGSTLLGGKPRWEKRFFVLKPAVMLYYFRSERDDAPLGCIDLESFSEISTQTVPSPQQHEQDYLAGDMDILWGESSLADQPLEAADDGGNRVRIELTKPVDRTATKADDAGTPSFFLESANETDGESWLSALKDASYSTLRQHLATLREQHEEFIAEIHKLDRQVGQHAEAKRAMDATVAREKARHADLIRHLQALGERTSTNADRLIFTDGAGVPSLGAGADAATTSPGLFGEDASLPGPASGAAAVVGFAPGELPQWQQHPTSGGSLPQTPAGRRRPRLDQTSATANLDAATSALRSVVRGGLSGDGQRISAALARQCDALCQLLEEEREQRLREREQAKEREADLKGGLYAAANEIRALRQQLATAEKACHEQATEAQALKRQRRVLKHEVRNLRQAATAAAAAAPAAPATLATPTTGAAEEAAEHASPAVADCDASLDGSVASTVTAEAEGTAAGGGAAATEDDCTPLYDSRSFREVMRQRVQRTLRKRTEASTLAAELAELTGCPLVDGPLGEDAGENESKCEGGGEHELEPEKPQPWMCDARHQRPIDTPDRASGGYQPPKSMAELAATVDFAATYLEDVAKRFPKGRPYLAKGSSGRSPMPVADGETPQRPARAVLRLDELEDSTAPMSGCTTPTLSSPPSEAESEPAPPTSPIKAAGAGGREEAAEPRSPSGVEEGPSMSRTSSTASTASTGEPQGTWQFSALTALLGTAARQQQAAEPVPSPTTPASYELEFKDAQIGLQFMLKGERQLVVRNAPPSTPDRRMPASGAFLVTVNGQPVGGADVFLVMAALKKRFWTPDAPLRLGFLEGAAPEALTESEEAALDRVLSREGWWFGAGASEPARPALSAV